MLFMSFSRRCCRVRALGAESGSMDNFLYWNGGERPSGCLLDRLDRGTMVHHDLLRSSRAEDM